MPPAVVNTPHTVTQQLVEAVAASNNHHRDLKFICSGISLSYHQSILFMNSPFLSNLLGSLACCRCEKAQCGRKEEVVIVLDKVDVGTVQALMEYLYRGECKVKDRKGFGEMKELVEMLGIIIHLEIEKKVTDDLVKVELCTPDSSEPNLEETVTDISLDIIVNELEDEQTRISEDIAKFMDKMIEGEVEQKCSKCDEMLDKESFMEHYKIHQEDVKSSLCSINLQKKIPNVLASQDNCSLEDPEASCIPLLQAKTEVIPAVLGLDDLKNVKDLEVEQTRLSKQVLLCMEVFEKGAKETSCTECAETIVKEELIEHFRIHVNQISDKISELSSVQITVKKKPGPKSRTRIGGEIKTKSQITNQGVEEGVDDPGALEVNTEVDFPVDVKKEIVSKVNVIVPKLKSKPRKKKSIDVSPTVEHVASDEYTCFNPTFKIKPGTKKVAKTKAKIKSSLAISVPVPEIKLTFNLDDLGFAAKEINLQDLSSGTPQVGIKRKDRSGDFPEVKRLKVVKTVDKKKSVSTSNKKRNRNKASESVLIEASKSKVNNLASQNNSAISIFSLVPPSTSCSSFPTFLRTVCSQAETVIPSGLDREQEELGRRVVHRLAGQRVLEGFDNEVAKEDVMREMGGEIDDEEDQANISSDGSEAPLVMDLDQEL